MTVERHDVVVAGSGFAATVLARVLRRAGREVLIVERGRHPRFALGESSTPLAAIALERLARRYGLPDLADLGCWSRWRRSFPDLGCGLKRGFTFWFHRPGEPWRPAPAGGSPNRDRLLVAASPNDEVADLHWLRADLDHHLVRRARAEGIEVREETRLDGAEETTDGMVLRGEHGGHRVTLHAAFVVDATGPGGFLSRALGLPEAAVATPLTGLLYTHLYGAPPLAGAAVDAAGLEEDDIEPGPYPDERAAVHHLIAGGWMYALRFDGPAGGGDGPVSAGFVLDPAGDAADEVALAARDAGAAWYRLLDRHPTLAAQLGDAEPAPPIAWLPRLPRRAGRAAGSRWALLPHAYAFFDPLFSTGIAWSLVGTERLAGMLASGPPGSAPAHAELARYDTLLATEADHLDRLIAGAWRAMPDPELFAAYSMLYFAAASFAEVRQRLGADGHPWADEGLLGATDAAVTSALGAALAALEPLAPGRRRVTRGERRGFAEVVASAITPRNLAGLADRRKRNLYPVDLDALVAAADLLGLTPSAVQAALPRLMRPPL